MDGDDEGSVHERWARLRFAIVGPLLASPPERGALQSALRELSQRKWMHPSSGEWVSFGRSTIERWYYLAKRAQRDPVGVLRRKVREDAGTHPSMTAQLRTMLRQQHKDHPKWSYRLHADNLVALVEEHPECDAVPSYPTVRRYMKDAGLLRQRRRGRTAERGARAVHRHRQQETRSYETAYVHGLWHYDFHESRTIALVTPWGTWEKPECFADLDDHSRLCCHAQWYWEESAETLAHGKSQSYLKRGLPRREMSDNGGAMLAEETQRAYERLGILHETTLPESPHQNAKAEKFWDTLEERLMAMLEGVENLTLELLNRATQAWVEREYNRRVHSELGVSPLHRYLHGKSLGRPSPDAETLRRAFRVRRTRTQRRSDGTISLKGQRFEIPSQYRTMTKIHIEFARWDLRHVDMVDPRTGERLCPIFPLDRHKNADGRRRRLADVEPGVQPDAPPAKSGMAPLLKQLITEYEASGLPPSFLPMNPTREDDITEDTEDTHTIQEDHDEDEPA